nr:hypothetical protein [Pseudomonas pudica]
MNRHKPESTECVCGCQPQRIGEDGSEKLDFTPEVFLLNVGRVLQEQKKQAQKNHQKVVFLCFGIPKAKSATVLTPNQVVCDGW